MADDPELVDTCNTIITGLAEQGWISIPDFLVNARLTELRSHFQREYQQGRFRAANIGRGATQQADSRIRGDEIAWIDSCAVGALGDFQQFTETLRTGLNQQLFLGAFETELHFALYPVSAAYQRHIDNFQGRSPRLVTVILYLNDNWQPDQGGQLRLYTAGQENLTEFTDILPEGGKLVVFLSEQFYHEVLPASRERLSLTGWLRRRE